MRCHISATPPFSLVVPDRHSSLLECSQTHKVVRELGTHTNLRAVALVGGDSMEAQFDDLSRNPDVLVATPGLEGLTRM